MNRKNRKKKGYLTIVPTPIDDDLPLDVIAQQKLLEATTANKSKSIIIVEELKIARRRWLKWDLPRESINDFHILNEHNMLKESATFLKKLQDGWDLYLLSDCGVPAFCDPGQILIDYCHEHNVAVTSTPCPNSLILAVALSGYPSNSFVFAGFLPARGRERQQALHQLINEPQMVVLMDAPYRLQSLLNDLKNMSSFKRDIFLSIDLNQTTEEMYRGKVSVILEKIVNFKREFVLIFRPLLGKSR